jgi:hypothetical protein
VRVFNGYGYAAVVSFRRVFDVAFPFPAVGRQDVLKAAKLAGAESLPLVLCFVKGMLLGCMNHMCR